MNHFDTDLATKLYKQGYNDIEIGKECNINSRTICDWRHKNGFEPNASFSSFDKTLAKELYLRGLSDKQIGTECDTTPGVIRNWRRKNNYLKTKSNPTTFCLDEHKAKVLYDKKASDRKISKSCNVSASTIRNWRNKYKLPAIKKTQSPLYSVWRSMIKHCEIPTNKGYKNYGARGITVCSEWHDQKTFIKWGMTHGYKKGLQIDRKDNNKGYFPDNCRFVTALVNNQNRRCCVQITIHSETKCKAEWARTIRVSENTIGCWIKKDGIIAATDKIAQRLDEINSQSSEQMQNIA